MQATCQASPQNDRWKAEECVLVDAILWAAANSVTGRRGITKYLRFPVGYKEQRRETHSVGPIQGLIAQVAYLFRAALKSAQGHTESSFMG